MRNPFKRFTDIKEVETNVEGPSPRIIHSKQKALERSINSGASSSVSATIATNFMTPFALALKATSFQIGILSSLSGLAAPISQLFGSKLMLLHSRKKIVLKFVFLQALMWIPLIFLSYLFWKGLFTSYLPYALIAIFTLMVSLGSVALPPWFSWIGDLMPKNYRGRYLGIRDRALETTAIATALVGAFILDSFQTRGLALLGFGILFTIALVFRLIAYGILKTEYAPEIEIKKGSYLSPAKFYKKFNNLTRFAIYQGTFFFALMIASPFFAVYMLGELQFSYLTFTLVTLSASVFYLLALPLFGKFSDRFGNTKLFYLANLLFVLTPLLWLASQKPIFLILVPQLLSGVANAAFLLSGKNFTYDSTPSEQRGIAKAYLAVLIGVGMFLGPLIGGFIIDYVKVSSINPFFIVFILSAFLRLLSGAIFLPRIKESRQVKELPANKIDFSHPVASIHSEINWFRSIFR